MRKRLTLPDEVCEKQETNKKMIRCFSFFSWSRLVLKVCHTQCEDQENTQDNYLVWSVDHLFLLRCARVLERIVNQNNFSDIALGLIQAPLFLALPILQSCMSYITFHSDFRFYEDQADDLRETEEGTLLPLWKFLFEKVS